MFDFAEVLKVLDFAADSAKKQKQKLVITHKMVQLNMIKPNMMDFVLKLMDFVLEMMDFVLKLMDFVLEMMDVFTENDEFSTGAVEGRSETGAIFY